MNAAEMIKAAAYQIGKQAIKDLDNKQESPDQKAKASKAECGK